MYFLSNILFIVVAIDPLHFRHRGLTDLIVEQLLLEHDLLVDLIKPFVPLVILHFVHEALVLTTPSAMNKEFLLFTDCDQESVLAGQPRIEIPHASAKGVF